MKEVGFQIRLTQSDRYVHMGELALAERCVCVHEAGSIEAQNWCNYGRNYRRWVAEEC